MPRRPRNYIGGMPYHVVQRGNNKDACFRQPRDYRVYLDMWAKVSLTYGTRVHAYCLMTNHVHFVVTPRDATSISNTTKVVGSKYARYFNVLYNRSGTLWEGRHKSSLIESSRYLLACYRYVEMNPVRAGMVGHPGEYPWSSYLSNAFGNNGWISSHDEYLALGNDGTQRQNEYRRLFEACPDDSEISFIRQSAHYCQPVASDKFKEDLEKAHGISLGQMGRGRPKKGPQD